VTDQTITVLLMLAAYMGVIVYIGYRSSRVAKATMEDFHMGGREFKSFVLFSAVFGANISAVTLIGVPGGSYHMGWIMWPYFVTAWGWLTPLLFYTVGSRSWKLGQRLGHMTIADVIGGRWQSSGLSVLISCILIIFTIPYLMTGLLAGGRTLQVLTDGFIPLWGGELVVAVAVVIYVSLGGMRGAAWVNTFQTTIFLLGGIAIFFVIASVLGGPVEATRKVVQNFPELITRENMPWKQFFSYGVIVGLSPVLFPQVFMRLLTGRNPKSLKQIMTFYPVAAFLIMFLMAMVGMWGAAAIPGLQGSESDNILPLLLTTYTPVWMMGILGAAAFSAMMSTMDSQLLCVTTMVTRDFLYRTKLRDLPEIKLVRISRVLVIVLTVLSYVLALLNPVGIIKIVEFAFAGFACMLAPMLGALYWQRCTKQAAFASIVVAEIFLVSLTFGFLPPSLTFGFLPGLPAMAIGLMLLVVVSYLTPSEKGVGGTKTYFDVFDGPAGLD
jgi:SSS family solute:Na+ symporter